MEIEKKMIIYDIYEKLMLEGESKDGNKWNDKGNDGLNKIVYELKKWQNERI